MSFMHWFRIVSEKIIHKWHIIALSLASLVDKDR